MPTISERQCGDPRRDWLRDGTARVGSASGGNLSSVIYRYRTDDGGSSWSRERVSDTPGQNIRPFVPANRSDKVQVLWAGAGRYAFYDFRANVESGYSTRIFAEWQAPARLRPANSAD